MLHLRSLKDVANLDKKIFTKKHVFSFVYMPGCPWCVNMMDEWNSLVKDPPKGALLMMVDFSVLKDLVAALSTKDDRNRFGHVRTVPALDLHRKKRRRVAFDGERTAKTMRTFVERKLV
jgi:hypothetical protein